MPKLHERIDAAYDAAYDIISSRNMAATILQWCETKALLYVGKELNESNDQ